MNNITEAIVTIGAAIVGVAILSVLVSNRSNTANVLSAAGSAFSNALGTAVSPVTGNQGGNTFGNFGNMGFQPGNIGIMG